MKTDILIDLLIAGIQYAEARGNYKEVEQELEALRASSATEEQLRAALLSKRDAAIADAKNAKAPAAS